MRVFLKIQSTCRATRRVLFYQNIQAFVTQAVHIITYNKCSCAVYCTVAREYAHANLASVHARFPRILHLWGACVDYTLEKHAYIYCLCDKGWQYFIQDMHIIFVYNVGFAMNCCMSVWQSGWILHANISKMHPFYHVIIVSSHNMRIVFKLEFLSCFVFTQNREKILRLLYSNSVLPCANPHCIIMFCIYKHI